MICTDCELSENASTVANVIKHEAKEVSLTRGIGIERYLSYSKLISEIPRILYSIALIQLHYSKMH